MQLLLVTQDFPPDVGGTQTYAFELARRFAIWCEDFAVIAPYVKDCERIDRQLPFDVFRVHSSYNALAIKAIPEIIRLARERGFDSTFHIQWSTAIAGIVARNCSYIKKVYAAAHGRELLLQPLPGPWLNGQYDRLRTTVLKHIDSLFPVSNYTKELLMSQGIDASKVFVTPNGVDTTRFCPLNATELKRSLKLTDKDILLTISRLVPRKGIDTVIKSLPHVLKSVPNLVYLIGGSGPDRERLENLVQQTGTSRQVQFLGRIPDCALPLHYNLCDVFTMPAHHKPPDVEGFGLVFLEAGACGKPVIGSTAGGIPDVINDGMTGILVSPGSPETLAKQLAHLLTHREDAVLLGKQALFFIRNHATWSHSAFHIFSTMQLSLHFSYTIDSRISADFIKASAAPIT